MIRDDYELLPTSHKNGRRKSHIPDERFRINSRIAGRLRSIPHMITKAAGYTRSILIIHSSGSSPAIHEMTLNSRQRKCSIGKSGKCSVRVENSDVADEHAILSFDSRSGQLSVAVKDERAHLHICCVVEDRREQRQITRVEKRHGPIIIPYASALLLGKRSWVTVIPNTADVLRLRTNQGHSAYCSDLQPRCLVGREYQEPNNSLSSGNQIEMNVEYMEIHHFCVRRISNVFVVRDLNTRAGTYLNNLRLHPEAHAILFPGARIYIGSPKDSHYVTVEFVGEIGMSPQISRRITRMRRNSALDGKRRKTDVPQRSMNKISPEPLL